MGGITVPEWETIYMLCCRRATRSCRDGSYASKNDVAYRRSAVARVLYQLHHAVRENFRNGLGHRLFHIWWPRVGEGGRSSTTDGDAKRADKARRYFERAGVSHGIVVRVGDALEFLSRRRAVRHHLQRTSIKRLPARLSFALPR